MTNKHKGIIYALFAVLLWSTLGLGFKLAVLDIDSFTVAIYVGIFATLALLVNIIIKQKLGLVFSILKKNYTFLILTGIMGLGIQQILYLKGYELLPASEVVTIFYLYPLIMVILSTLIYKEKTSLVSYLYILLGFLGVYVLVSKGDLFNFNFGIGIIVILLASFSWALFSVLIKHKEIDIDTSMFLFNLFGLLFLMIMIPVFGFHYQVSALGITGLMYLGIFPTAIAFVLWNNALRLTKTHVIANIALLTPLISLLLIALILKEQFHYSLLIGLAMIVGSVFLNLRYRSDK